MRLLLDFEVGTAIFLREIKHMATSQSELKGHFQLSTSVLSIPALLWIYRIIGSFP